jgi:hypothetical protein
MPLCLRILANVEYLLGLAHKLVVSVVGTEDCSSLWHISRHFRVLSTGKKKDPRGSPGHCGLKCLDPVP